MTNRDDITELTAVCLVSAITAVQALVTALCSVVAGSIGTSQLWTRWVIYEIIASLGQTFNDNHLDNCDSSCSEL